MGKGFLFFAFSCCILVLSIINLSIGPVVSKVVGKTKVARSEPELEWDTPNCARLRDMKDDSDDDDQKKYIQPAIDACERNCWIRSFICLCDL